MFWPATNAGNCQRTFYLAEPLLDLSMDEERAVSLATIAWNLSLVLKGEQGLML